MTSDELNTKWDTYLGKLKVRYYEILSQASAPLDEVINNLQYDDIIIHNIKTGLYNQAVTQLSLKADQGWMMMDTEMQKQGKFFWNQKAEQHKKLDDFKEFLEVEFLKFETALYARAAHKILENVKQHIQENKMHRCTQCGAELPIKIYSFVAMNIKCDSCGSVNTYQPDDRIRALEWYVVTPLAEEYALNEKIRSRTDKNAKKEYYAKYYNYLMENIPDKKEYYQRDLQERLTNSMFQ